MKVGITENMDRFEQNFKSCVENAAFLGNDTEFKKKYGFTMTEYISKGNILILGWNKNLESTNPIFSSRSGSIKSTLFSSPHLASNSCWF